MPDNLVGKLDPPLFWNDLHEVLLDFLGIFVARQVQAVGNADDVSIHDNAAGDSKSSSEDDIGGFSRSAGKREHFFHGLRHSPAKLFHDGFARTHNGFGFVAEESSRANLLLEVARIRICEGFRRWIFLIERFRHLVYAHIGALRGEDRGNQQLKRVFVLQLAGRGGIRLV